MELETAQRDRPECDHNSAASCGLPRVLTELHTKTLECLQLKDSLAAVLSRLGDNGVDGGHGGGDLIRQLLEGDGIWVDASECAPPAWYRDLSVMTPVIKAWDANVVNLETELRNTSEELKRAQRDNEEMLKQLHGERSKVADLEHEMGMRIEQYLNANAGKPLMEAAEEETNILKQQVEALEEQQELLKQQVELEAEKRRAVERTRVADLEEQEKTINDYDVAIQTAANLDRQHRDAVRECEIVNEKVQQLEQHIEELNQRNVTLLTERDTARDQTRVETEAAQRRADTSLQALQLMKSVREDCESASAMRQLETAEATPQLRVVEDNQQLTVLVAELTEDLKKEKKSLERVKIDLRKRDAEIRALKEVVKDHEEESTKYHGALMKLREESSAFKTERGTLRTEIAELKRQNQAIAVDAAAWSQAEADGGRQRLGELEREIGKKQDQLEELGALNDDLRTQIEKVWTSQCEAEAQRQTTDAQLQGVQEQLKEAQAEAAKLRVGEEKAQRDLKRRDEKLKRQYEAQLAAMRQQVQELEHEKDKLLRTLDQTAAKAIRDQLLVASSASPDGHHQVGGSPDRQATTPEREELEQERRDAEERQKHLSRTFKKELDKIKQDQRDAQTKYKTALAEQEQRFEQLKGKLRSEKQDLSKKVVELQRENKRLRTKSLEMIQALRDTTTYEKF
eukprot:GHVU01087746.1.p1 GENE.GHVU01087746.1~~GHVU01087746.1.p1  ORF type:complete len:685 (+),score=201.30 GHVU01087746.1:173-2227(+)